MLCIATPYPILLSSITVIQTIPYIQRLCFYRLIRKLNRFLEKKNMDTANKDKASVNSRRGSQTNSIPIHQHQLTNNNDACPPDKTTQNITALIERQRIEKLEEPEVRKCGEFHYYCLHCETYLRNERHIRDHVITREHQANHTRWQDRNCLKRHFEKIKSKYASSTHRHIQALGLLSVSSQQHDSGLHEAIHNKNISHILDAIKLALQNVFRFEQAVDIRITGSFLTGLHKARENICDLNLFAQHEKFNDMELSSVFLKMYEALKEVNRHFTAPGNSATPPVNVRRMMTNYGVPTLQLYTPIGQFCYCVSIGLGMQAEKAYWSTRLVLAYSHIWPPLKRLILFVRYWAEINHLNFKACGGISSFAFDILCIFYLQRTGYLPVLNQLVGDPFTDYPLINAEFRSVDQLCRLSDEEFLHTCRQIRAFYYGNKIPLLTDGDLIYGFFKYFGTEFDLHTKCDITSNELVDKRNNCERHFVIIDPFLNCNILKLRLEGNAHIWNCLIKAAAYLCIPRTLEGPLFDIHFGKTEIEFKKSKFSYLTIKSDERNNKVHSLIKTGDCFFEYTLDGLNMQPSELPPMSCQHCNQQGHCDWDCFLLRPSSLCGLIGPLRPILLAQFSKAIKDQHESTSLNKKRLKAAEKYIGRLESTLAKELEADDLKLTPFGSIINGFGTNDCDLDLCLQSAKITLTGDIIRKLDKKLQNMGCRTEPVFSAKVPIVKFKQQNEFRGDISVGNCLGLKNSEMLHVYTQLDARVAPLGFFIKHWFKQNHLNSSPEGSFSSYSLIILLIAYLQRGCKPPVLPYLQELAKDDEPREMLEGWDVTFARNPSQYQSDGERIPNTQTLAELFVGFLRYYLTEFDPKMDVVQIRRSAPLMKMDKNGTDRNGGSRRWDQYTFCVEDPFDLNHNLCGGVKQEVLFQFYDLLKRTLRELALLDQKLDRSKQWGGRSQASHMLNLMQNCGGNSAFSVIPKLLGFLC